MPDISSTIENPNPIRWENKKVIAAAQRGPKKAVAFPENVNMPNPNPCISSGMSFAMTTLLELCRGPEKKVPITARIINAVWFVFIDIETIIAESNAIEIIIIFLSFLKNIPKK